MYSITRRIHHFLSSTAMCEAIDPSTTIFQFNIKDMNGNDINMASMKGKAAILIVNVASQ